MAILKPTTKIEVPPWKRLGAGARAEYEKGKPEVYVPSGFKPLDDKILGAVAAELVLIAGAPGHGKTSLGMQWAVNTAQNGQTVGVLSLEMKERGLRNRLVAGVTGIYIEAIRAWKLTKKQEQLVYEAADWLDDLPLFVDDRSGVTADQAYATVLEWKKRGAELVIVDYVQYMKGDNESRNVIVSDSVRALKAGAKDADIPVIAMAATNRNAAQNANRLPSLHDLRDTSELEYSADTILMFHYPEEDDRYENKRLVDIHIVKQRNGPTGVVSAIFNKPATRFEPVEGQ